MKSGPAHGPARQANSTFEKLVLDPQLCRGPELHHGDPGHENASVRNPLAGSQQVIIRRMTQAARSKVMCLRCYHAPPARCTSLRQHHIIQHYSIQLLVGTPFGGVHANSHRIRQLHSTSIQVRNDQAAANLYSRTWHTDSSTLR
jgi:hypothetical protein